MRGRALASGVAFHTVALAKSEQVARAVYPVALADVDHDGADIATGSGVAKVIFGPSNFPITGGSTHGGGSIAFNNGFGPPVCGVAAFGQQPCTFSGGDDIEVIGPTPGFGANGAPDFVDQLVHKRGRLRPTIRHRPAATTSSAQSTTSCRARSK